MNRFTKIKSQIMQRSQIISYLLNNVEEAGFILRPGHLLDPVATSAACGSIKSHKDLFVTVSRIKTNWSRLFLLNPQCAITVKPGM